MGYYLLYCVLVKDICVIISFSLSYSSVLYHYDE